MADTEEPQFNTLKERIAALNKQKNFNDADGSRKPAPPPVPRPARDPPPRDSPTTNGVQEQRKSPAIPNRPSKPSKAAPPPLPRRDTQTSQGASPINEPKLAPPPLPSRSNSAQTPPALPRRTTPQNQAGLLPGRRGSASSEASQRSAISVASRGSDGRRMAPVYDQASLPPLPPSRRESELAPQPVRPGLAPRKSSSSLSAAMARTGLTGKKSASSLKTAAAAQPGPKPGLPPRLPSRSATQASLTNGKEDHASAEPAQPAPPPRKNIVMGFGSGKSSRASVQQQKTDEPPPAPETANDEPPPIPTASRPTASQIDAANERMLSGGNVDEDCWVCRDWSGPDNLASKFPRESLPRQDPVGYLARNLCDPFPSYTDKARAIFTWFHYNIYYDTYAFFNKCVKEQTADSTILTGKAVCAGYAETYKAIANRAGLECIVVGGHGKGYGYSALKPGERPPPAKPDGHAWNAVRIDGGRWKLLDACWGAGHLDGSTNEYKQVFSPKHFIASNDVFSESHFPKDSRYQFRDDGRVQSWEEYYIGRSADGEPPVLYTTGHDEGILESSILPRCRQIPVQSDAVIRFQWSKLCRHWRSETHGKGKPPLWLLSIHGVDGRKDDMVPVQTDGYWHWVDVKARDLGAPGQTLQVAQVTTIGGKDARGVSAKEYFEKKGKVGMAWSYVLKWELV
ncbi:uncharacterized protein F5Z01DRAFT_314489 [Emericellopsis atlantica]|uniref:Transglutaminase-like domain-containing protein n=1 Tax=Emericellopsis atlantica TaxID=2614577 RepID=A0A9P8CV78_9HYPO|nr:uncharacterized protein F5Z01DRAFT_314489 [Emericellopsis atlantica]KAG9258031.1 hypothetical protein F5Z01DRAFT_314489 [Emericellopsis atlantica]